MTLNAERVEWGVALLARLGFFVRVNCLTAVVAWEMAEGGGFGNVAAYNPLNTTEVYGGSFPIDGDGVQAYRSYADGLAATVLTLQFGAYAAIRGALSVDAPPALTAEAIGDSEWGTALGTVLGVVPLAARAVANYYPPGGPLPYLIEETDGVVYEILTVGGNPRSKALEAKDAAKFVATGVPVVSDPDGGLLNRYPVWEGPLP